MNSGYFFPSFSFVSFASSGLDSTKLIVGQLLYLVFAKSFYLVLPPCGSFGVRMFRLSYFAATVFHV